MNNTKTLAGVFISIFLVVVGAWLLIGPAESQSYVEIRNNRIEVQVAATVEEQIKGLSGRESLPSDEGLLFVYESSGFQKFWMKDMNFPIDIIWIGEDKTVVDITEDLHPETYPRTFSPAQPAQYVLEVNAGYTQEQGIIAGDYVTFDLN